MAIDNDLHTRFDERDTIFSRIRLHPETGRYKDYYLRNPGKKEIDDTFRSYGAGQFSDRLPEAAMVESTFGIISQLRALVRGYEGEYRYSPPESVSGEALTKILKQQAGRYGAVFSEAVEMEERFSYSVRGRGSRYGEKVDKVLPTAFVIAVPMDKEEISTGPGIREAVEVANAYLRAAIPALTQAAFLRSLGYEAVAHIDGESELVMPPLAHKAGFGKIGRHGLLVSKTYGSLVRLSAVTTDAPLVVGSAGEEENFPLEKACEACRRCADFCPSSAIPGGSIIDRWEEAVRRVDHEACFDMWKRFGTDCGVCIAVCPYTRGAPSATTLSNSSAHKNLDTQEEKAETVQPGSPDFLKNYMFGNDGGGVDS